MQREPRYGDRAQGGVEDEVYGLRRRGADGVGEADLVAADRQEPFRNRDNGSRIYFAAVRTAEGNRRVTTHPETALPRGGHDRLEPVEGALDRGPNIG